MNVLFVCKANVGRSQMASAFFSRMSKKHRALCAGTHVGVESGRPLHESVVKAMAELGYDLSRSTRKQLTPQMVRESEHIVVMSEEDSLPDYLANQPDLVFWEIDDAKDKSYEFHVKIRDQIKKLVESLVKEIG